MASFRDYIAARRKALKLAQKDVASQLKKEDGIPISLSYFHDIEAGKRWLTRRGPLYQHGFWCKNDRVLR